VAEIREVARTAEIPPGSTRCVDVGGRRIAVFNVGGRLYAVDDACTHRGGPLSQGNLEGHRVTCPWHGGRFDLETGNAVGPPAARSVTTYRVVVEGDQVKLEL
jgi:nitrite reductase/ring-hydroxylating ferredoxin subunit